MPRTVYVVRTVLPVWWHCSCATPHHSTGLTAQTFNPKEPVDPSTLPIKYHRNSQTYTCKTRSSQCVRECGTQVLG